MNIATILVLANLCASPVYDRDTRCIQFIMEKQNCEALVERQKPRDTSPHRRRTGIEPFTIECHPIPNKGEDE